jgi:peptidoglycan/xylan/chitin deacetylase (PgdA/CDA1 family)
MDELNVHAGGVEVATPADFRWPGGKRLAVFFRVAFEWWSDGKWPGIGPMGNPLKQGVVDLNAIGWAEYGHRRGIHRALNALAHHGVKATVMVSGIMAERHGDIVRAIAEAGHDIVAHSYAMDVIPIYLTEEEERANIRRTTDLIERAIGRRPQGWISPRGTPSPRTARLCAEEGYTWHGDTLNDDLPYIVRFGDKQIVAFPGNMEINDLPLYMRHGNSPRMMIEMFEDWLHYVRTRETEAARVDPTIHSHVFGRVPGILAFERLMEIAVQAPDIWVGTRTEAVTHLNSIMRNRKAA